MINWLKELINKAFQNQGEEAITAKEWTHAIENYYSMDELIRLQRGTITGPELDAMIKSFTLHILKRRDHRNSKN